MNENDREPDRIDSEPVRRPELPRGMTEPDAPPSPELLAEIVRREQDCDERPDDWLPWENVLEKLKGRG